MITKLTDDLAHWSCSNCEFKTSSDAVSKAIATIHRELEEVQSLPNNAIRIEHCEQLLSKYSSILHENHSILTTIRQQLIELFKRVDRNMYTNMPAVVLDRKLFVYRQVLNILNIFNPGLTRSRALLLYDMHFLLILSGRAKLNSNQISVDDYKKIVNETIGMLEVCSSILQWEDAQSVESVINRGVMVTLKHLRTEVCT